MTQKKDEKTKQEASNEESQNIDNRREIIIRTDGSNIELAKAEVAGNLELRAILSSLLEEINRKQ